MNDYMIRRAPEPGYRWYVRDADSGAVLGWFDYQVVHRFADERRQTGREVEIGCGWRSFWQPPGLDRRSGRRAQSLKRARHAARAR
jgi:hypothetical protein